MYPEYFSGTTNIFEKISISKLTGQSHENYTYLAESILYIQQETETRFRGKIKLVLIDGYQGYEKFIRKYLGIKAKKPVTGVINKSRYNQKTGRFYTFGLFGVSGKTVDKVIHDLGIGETITTALIENLNSFIRDSAQYMARRSKRLARIFDWMVATLSGYFFFHNFLKAHWGLSKRSSKNWIKDGVTPAMACGITFTQFSLYEILTFHQH